jgi:predicted permease
MRSLWADTRFAVRRLLRSPGFTLVAVLSLGLSIGVNTSLFSFINALLLRPIPYARDPDRQVRIFSEEEAGGAARPVSFPNYLDLTRSLGTFSGLLASTTAQISLGSGDHADLEKAELVTGNYFRVLGVEPALGRGFLPGEGEVSGRDPVVVISHALWERNFASDPGLVGGGIWINGQKMTVIGVAPKGFSGLSARHPVQAWVPLSMRRQLLAGPLNDLLEDRASRIVAVVGRLRPGADLPAARAAVASAFADLKRSYPEANSGHDLLVLPLREALIEPAHRRKYLLAGTFLMVVSGLVLLIACANLANLLLARAVNRYKEVAIRVSLGAGGRHLLRLLLAEAGLLALAGGAAGLLLTVWSRDVLWSLRPPEIPQFLDIGLDGRVLGFTLLLALATGLLFGLAPVLRLARPDLVSSLKNETGVVVRERKMMGPARLLVAVQTALTLVAVVGAGLFLRSLANAQRYDPGFEVERQAVLGFDLSTLGYAEARGQAFYQAMLEKVERLPDVASAGIAESLVLYPSAMGAWLKVVTIEGEVRSEGGEEHLIQSNTVSSGYFRTMGIPLRAGRLFDATDREGTRDVVVINETMAERFWPGRSAVGMRIHFQGEGPREVIGVVRDAKYNSLGEDPTPYVYSLLLQNYTAPAFLHVRTHGDAAEALPLVRREVQNLDSHLGLAFVMPMTAVFARNLWAPNAGATLLVVFGALALSLAVLGVYGTATSAVAQRRREIGIRLAVGARRAQVLSLILWQGMAVVAVGLAVGLGLALVLGRLVARFLFGLRGTDPWSLVLAVAILIGASLLANLLAARRAMAVQPMEVMR